MRLLVFDGQVFQTPAWHRGMGKYSMELIGSISELNRGKNCWQEIQVVFTSRLPVPGDVLSALKNKAPEVKVVKLKFANNEYDNRPVASKNRRLIDEYFQSLGANNMKIDYVILSLMQSEIAPAFSGLNHVNNFLLFYDLIPLMFHKTYLKDSLTKKGYLTKLNELLMADYFLAISKTVANDLSVCLGIDPKRIISIDGAPIDHGSKTEPIDIKSPYILMPTGNDLRKNNRRGIEGFAKFNRKRGNKYKLVVTSVFQDFEVNDYKKLNKNLVFTGNVSGEQLEYLYENTAALLFPTEYEGLGLPVLEAVQKNKPVACSDISVFREISTTAFSFFDPKNPEDIAVALDRAVSKNKTPARIYKRIRSEYTWRNTAELFQEFVTRSSSVKKVNKRKSKLLVFSVSTDESDQGVEIQQTVTELSRRTEAECYMDSLGEKIDGNINYLPYTVGSKNMARRAFVDLGAGDKALIFLENTANSAALLPVALALKGAVVLNELNLTDLWDYAVKRKIIDRTRLQAEDYLEKRLKISGRLVSILAMSSLVIVRSSEHAKILKGIVARLPGENRPQIVIMGHTRSDLVYEGLNWDNSVYDYPNNINLEYGNSFTEQAARIDKLVFGP